MGDEYGRYGQNPDPTNNGQPGPDNQDSQDNIDKRIEDIRRVVTRGANEATQRFRKVVDKAGGYWQQAQTTPTPRPVDDVEEQRIRQLTNIWSNENWRTARDLGTYMDLRSYSNDEAWEITLQTRWETRTMEVVSEPYAGKTAAGLKPLLPVWDYELPEVVGLKAPSTRTRLEGLDETVGCTACNGTGHVLCSNCNGRGWVVCPDCKGRTKKRCSTCHGRGYVADWSTGEKKTFFKKQADSVVGSVGNRVSDVFEGIRQQGVPIPNPVDTDPAAKGPTIPCPDCVKGEVDCTCGNGKRVCEVCQGAKMSPCATCGRTGKVVRHREIVRRFDLRTQTRFIGDCPIPAAQLVKASGDLIYNDEVKEPLYADASPEGVPMDVWRATVELVQSESVSPTKATVDPQAASRATLQVIELVRITYTTVQYHYNNQDYTLYIYDGEGREKFYSDRFPARWDRIERLVKAISNDLLTPAQKEAQQNNQSSGPYRVPVEVPPYSISEEDDDLPGKQ
jgi:hypothetical protein